MQKSFTEEDVENNINRLITLYPHLNEFPHTVPERKLSSGEIFGGRSIADKIRENYQNLAWPNHPNWTYCIPIISNVEIEGRVLDLGIHIHDDWITRYREENSDCSELQAFSGNVVSSNEGPDYGSGPMGASSLPYKTLLKALNRWEIATHDDMANAILGFNSFMRMFYDSDLDMFELHDLVSTHISKKED